MKGRAKTSIAVPGLVEGVGGGNWMIFKELSNPKQAVVPFDFTGDFTHAGIYFSFHIAGRHFSARVLIKNLL